MTMENLHKLAELNKCNFHLAYNEHKTFYESAKQYYTEPPRDYNPDEVGDIDYTKPVWELRIYPFTPISFFWALSNDVDMLLQWGVELLERVHEEDLAEGGKLTQTNKEIFDDKGI